MFERISQDGIVNEPGLSLVVSEEKPAGKLPRSFNVKDILMDRFVKKAASSVRRPFGLSYE